MSELTLEGLSKQFEELQKQNAEILAANEKLAASNEELKKILGSATSLEVGAKEEDPTIPDDEVTIEKKTYKFTVAMFYPPNSTETITAKEASTDKAMLAQIVKIPGQGILKEVM